ncbi:hypothetical protein [Rubritalea tangerina]
MDKMVLVGRSCRMQSFHKRYELPNEGNKVLGEVMMAGIFAVMGADA